MPTRMIDVGSQNESPFLYCTEGKSAPYVALSYCWGPDQSALTTQEKLGAFKKGIRATDLPKTIQDAILIVRKMGMRNLWVDALCIVQDSEEDFIREVAVMGDIFSNASFTIAVKDSASSADGCFHDRAWGSPAAFPLDIRLPGGTEWNHRTSNISRLMLMPKLNHFKDRKTASILDSRGWTLQEDVLSPRVLQFWHEEIKWICLEATWSETDLDDHFSWSSHDRDMKLKPMLAKIGMEGTEPPDANDMFRHWRGMVQEFSTRELSKPADKLSALLGLQKRIAVTLKDVPVAGGWRDHYFWPSLLWTCKPGATRGTRAPFICPSWSWASVEVAVTYSEFSFTGAGTFLPGLKRWDVHIENAHNQVTGSIIVKGSLLSYQELLVQRARRTKSGAEEAIGVFPAASRGGWNFGRENIFKDPHFVIDESDAWFLLLADVPYEPPARHGLPAWPGGRPPSVILMCLEKLSVCEMRFRRIGLAEVWDDVDWRGRCRTETIELV